jgi:hypothetical protein
MVVVVGYVWEIIAAIMIGIVITCIIGSACQAGMRTGGSGWGEDSSAASAGQNSTRKTSTSGM